MRFCRYWIIRGPLFAGVQVMIKRTFESAGLFFEILFLASLPALSTPVEGSTLNRTEFCRNPARFICDEKVNPYLRSILRKEKELEAIRVRAEHEPDIQQFILSRPHSKPKGGGPLTWHDLESGTDQNECNDMVSHKVGLELYTKDRRSTAERLFGEARKSIIQALSRRAVYFESIGKRKEAQEVYDLYNTLGGLVLVFGRNKDVFSTKYELSAHYYPAEFSKEGDHVVSSFTKKHPTLPEHMVSGEVYIENLVYLADDNPEALRKILAHEIIHAILKNRIHLFENEHKCVQRADSVAAALGSVECAESEAAYFNQLAASFMKGSKGNLEYVAQAQPCVEMAKALRKDPDESGFNCSRCQQSQTWEALADLLGLDAIEYEKPKIAEWKEGVSDVSHLPGFDQVAKMAAAECSSHYMEQKEIADQISESAQQAVRDRWAIDSHPLPEDRIGALLMAHPNYRYCPTDNAIHLASLDSEPKQGDLIYCGPDLYKTKFPSK